MMPKRILLAFSDPGGANECAAIVRDLAPRGFAFVAVTDEHGWIPPGLATITEKIAQDQLANFITQLKPDRVLTGTSVRSEIELRVLEIARTLRIPTAALIDHWTNYAARFKRDSIAVMPDQIFVNDEGARSQAIEENLPVESLRILANPHFRPMPRESTPFDRSAGRSKLGLQPDQPVILLLSDALTESEGDSARAQARFGYTEFTVLSDLLETLEKIDSDHHWQVLIKPHPRETPDKYRSILARFQRTIAITPSGYPLFDAFQIADRWIGMFTAALIELNGCGYVPLRYEPEARENLLPVELKIFGRITSKRQLEPTLQSYLNTSPLDLQFDPRTRTTDYTHLLEFFTTQKT